MLINRNTQLGLRVLDTEIQLGLYEALKVDFDYHKTLLDISVERIVEKDGEDGKKKSVISFDNTTEQEHAYQLFIQFDVIKKLRDPQQMNELFKINSSKYFFICESVYKAAELIKIGTAFTGRILSKVKPGTCTYLMGKDKFVRFNKNDKGIIGFYYDRSKGAAFEWGCEVETGGYYFSPLHKEESISVMQILCFIELGDIEIVELLGGRNNGKSRKEGKLVNESKATVYVVDSRWNTITIRTEAFGVRGHFRLQACGAGMIDRKLIWINAFEKHGYIRRPTGEIINH